MVKDASRLRLEAERCRRLADAMWDLVAYHRLRAKADELERQAAAMAPAGAPD